MTKLEACNFDNVILFVFLNIKTASIALELNFDNLSLQKT